MKKITLYSLSIVAAGYLLAVILVASGYLYAGISPYAHYQLNENETKLFDEATARLRERVENEKFDEIENEIVAAHGNKKQIIEDLKKARRKMGKPNFTQHFRVMPPEPAARYYDNLNGTYYNIQSLTNTDDGDFYPEHFQWIVTENNEARLLSYSYTYIRDWQLQELERDKRKERFSNEIKIPFGERFIEIRY